MAFPRDAVVLKGVKKMNLNGYQGLNPLERQFQNMQRSGERVKGAETQRPRPMNQDTYTPSQTRTAEAEQSAEAAVSQIAQSFGLELEGNATTTPVDAEGYQNYLLSEYDGMIEYNITVSDELLQKAVDDPEIAKKLETYIAQSIAAHDNYDGEMVRVHTETEIQDISNGIIKEESMHVFASAGEVADLFDGKAEMDSYLNDVERLLLSGATGGTELSETETDILNKVLSTFDEVYNGINASTGYANFLNAALLSPEHITGDVVADNERIMGDVASLKEELTALLDGDEISDEVRSVLEEALSKCDDVLGGDSPLYDVITKEIEVTYSGRFDKDEFDSTRPALSDSYFFGDDKDSVAISFQDYMMQSNANLIQLMSEAMDTETKEDVVAKFYEELLAIIEEREEARLEAEQEEALEKEEALESENDQTLESENLEEVNPVSGEEI